MRKRLDPTKKKIPKDCKPRRRFRRINRETMKAIEEAQSWDYSKKTNITRKWGKFKVLTDYPSEIRYVNEMRKKAKDGHYKKRVFFY